MHYRKLGRTGIEVSEIGFGGWGIGGEWGGTDDDQARAALERAFDLGITFYDTAHVYGDGHSEKLIGQVFAGRRDRVVIATKVPPKNYRWPVTPNDDILDTFPGDWIVQCTEESLKRLGTDYIDVQQLHAWTPGYTEIDEWYDALTRLKEQGKIRAFGVSANDWDPYGAVDLVRSGRVQSVQVIYNIFDQRPEESLFPAALSQDTGIIVRVPFEEGLLTGQLRPGYEFAEGDWRAEWLDSERLEEAASRVDELRPFLGSEAPDLATLALKFCLSHAAVSTVIPGMRRPAHVEANAAASDGLPLTEATRTELRKHAFVHGWSYPWSETDLVIVDSFADPTAADLARLRLNAEGIEAVLKSDSLSAMGIGVAAGTDILVRRGDLERAAEVLRVAREEVEPTEVEAERLSTEGDTE